MAAPHGPRKRTLKPGKRPKTARVARREIKKAMKAEEIPVIPEVEHLPEGATALGDVVVESAPVVTGGPTTGALPRKKRDVPAHIKAAVARAEATSKGKDLPAPDETGVDPALVAEYGSAAPKPRKDRKAKEPAASPVPPGPEEKPDPATLPKLVGGALLFELPKTTGRDTEYEEHFPDMAKELCTNGATDFDLADLFEVSVRTIYRWKAKHIAFRQAIYLGSHAYQAAQNENVERSLYQRATGYVQPVEKIMSFQGQIMRVETTEFVPGDVAAAKHWLANRRPDQWKVDPDKSSGGTNPDGTVTMSMIEMARAVAYALGQGMLAMQSLPEAQALEVIDADDSRA
jgi:hypothetical protein